MANGTPSLRSNREALNLEDGKEAQCQKTHGMVVIDSMNNNSEKEKRIEFVQTASQISNSRSINQCLCFSKFSLAEVLPCGQLRNIRPYPGGSSKFDK